MSISDQKRIARTAGIYYLILGITGGFGILYVPLQIIVEGNATLTSQNIVANEFLYRLGMVGQLTCQVFMLLLVLKLKQLFRNIDEQFNLLMVTLVVVSVPIAFLNMVFYVAPMVLHSNAGYLSAFNTEQLDSLSMAFFKLYQQGIILVQIFWGLWLIPFGMLAFKSGFIPRIIGVLLIIGGIGYVIASLTGLLFPGYSGTVDLFASIPAGIAEFATIFWLLIKGVKNNSGVKTELE